MFFAFVLETLSDQMDFELIGIWLDVYPVI
jgi:hypothetical protein